MFEETLLKLRFIKNVSLGKIQTKQPLTFPANNISRNNLKLNKFFFFRKVSLNFRREC